MSEGAKFIFDDAKAPFGYVVCLSSRIWKYKILNFHPEMFRREGDVRLSIEQPTEIQHNCQENRDNFVFWKSFERDPWERFLKVAVALDMQTRTGFITTAHPSPRIGNVGRKIWPISDSP